MENLFASKHAMHAERVDFAQSTYSSLCDQTRALIAQMRLAAPEAIVFEWSTQQACYLKHTHHSALDKALAVLGQYERLPNQEPTQVVRLPGVIFLDPSFEEAILRLNETKQNLADQIQLIPPGSRNRLTRKAFGVEVSTLQLYRQWHMAHDKTLKLSFTEAKAGTGISWITTQKLVNHLKESINHPAEGTHIANWNKMIEIEIEKLSEYHSTEELMIQKPVARHPRCNMYDAVGQRHYAMKAASIPIICFAPASQVRVKPFTQTEGYTEHRADAHRKELIIERLHVYYVPGGRKRPPQAKTA